MAKGISDLKAITKANFAKPSLFKVVMNRGGKKEKEVGEDLFINCFQANIPGSSVASTERDKAFRSYAYQKLYEDVTFGFYCTEEFKELEFLNSWLDSVAPGPLGNNHLEYYEKYAGYSNIKIINLSNDAPSLESENKKTITTTLHEAYPKSVSAIQLDYGTTNAIIQVTATFTYRYYTQSFGDKELSETERNLKFIAKNLKHLGTEGIKFDNGLINSALDKVKYAGKAAITQASEDLIGFDAFGDRL